MDTMSRRLNNTVVRGAAAVVLAGGAALALAGGARADGLPLPPAPSLAAPSLPTPTPSSSATLLPAKVDANLPILNQAPAPPASPLPPVSGAPAPAPLVDGLQQASVGVKGALDQVGQATAGTPLSVLNTSGAAARVAAVTVDADPLATACVQATGTGTAVANVDLTALGTDLGTPAQQTLPGVVNACPAGTGAGSGTGNGTGTPGTGTDTVATAGATAGSLVGACARLTTSVVPVESTVVVLDQDLITSLTNAGLPLDQLVVPCPTDGNGGGTGGGNGGGSGGGTGGTGGDNGGSGGASGSAGTGTGGSSSAASDVPSLGGSLPFTGAQVSLFLMLASALLASGAMLVARARRAGSAAVRLV